MKIRVSKNLIVDSSTLVRIEWRKYYPVLVVHERFERKVKGIVWVLTIIGILTSVIVFSKWFIALGVSILIFLLCLFFQKAALEYTTFIVQPPPNFTIDHTQWRTNGFMIPTLPGYPTYFGPSFVDENYAKLYFDYLKSWNWGSHVDAENNIIVSFIIEEGNRYTTYLYSNPRRKNLSKMFTLIRVTSLFEKFGKRQQQLFMQMIYWRTLDFIDGFFIKHFLEVIPPNGEYYLTPCILPEIEGNAPTFLDSYSILKFEYKLKHRRELTEFDVEFYNLPTE